MAILLTLLGLPALIFGITDAIFHTNSATEACKEIEGKISKDSGVVYPINLARYNEDTRHWFLSSNDKPACVVEAGSQEDISLVLRIVGESRTPFAVYSAGHASNPGFSSTTGVHISLTGFTQVKLSEDKKTVWTNIYDALKHTGVNVVGGRVPGPGVGGFTLGGGYSWKTNQYGLTCDTVKSFNLVLPNGTITTASSDYNKDLFFALKGGLNRFGIVTSAEYYTHPQTPKVWGGLRIYLPSQVHKLLNATERFAHENKDAKAGLIVTLDGGGLGVGAKALLFNDGPEKPPIFDLFDGFLTTLDNIGSKLYKEFIYSFPSNLVTNCRGRFATFSTSALTGPFIEAVRAEAEAIGKVSALHSGTTVSFDIEPFTNYGQFDADAAYPHADSPLPLNLYFAWTNPAKDDWWVARMNLALNKLRQVAVEEDIYKETFTDYPNYALTETTGERLYGSRNAARLRAIRDRIDPDRIMDLAGGFAL
ncbi:hypothetical protein VTI74DRAFT_6679 [Chaetomium olivicolor]